MARQFRRTRRTAALLLTPSGAAHKVRVAPSANASMTGNAPTFATLFLRVFLPFAFAYFLSYIFRGVNAVIFPYLERDIGITAGDLGLLTSAFFLFFAGCQPVLGVMLDRYGPRRVQAVLLADGGAWARPCSA